MTEILLATETARAAQLLQQGELVAFPTETVYGLGALANNETAVQRVYAAKGRPSDNPLIVHVSNLAQVTQCVTHLPAIAEQLMAAFWPGALTIILPANHDVLAPSVIGKLTTVAVRMPQHPVALSLIEAAGFPLVGPSANLSGKPSPTQAQHVYDDLAGSIAAVIDGGQTSQGIESTVIDVSVPEHPVILRPGPVTLTAINAVLAAAQFPLAVTSEEVVHAPKSPGMKYQHYAPTQPVILVAGEHMSEAVAAFQAAGCQLSVLATEPVLAQLSAFAGEQLSLGKDASDASKRLYAALRQVDRGTSQLVLAQIFAGDDLAQSLMNRLDKAAGGKYYAKPETWQASLQLKGSE